MRERYVPFLKVQGLFFAKPVEGDFVAEGSGKPRPVLVGEITHLFGCPELKTSGDTTQMDNFFGGKDGHVRFF